MRKFSITGARAILGTWRRVWVKSRGISFWRPYLANLSIRWKLEVFSLLWAKPCAPTTIYSMKTFENSSWRFRRQLLGSGKVIKYEVSYRNIWRLLRAFTLLEGKLADSLQVILFSSENGWHRRICERFS